MNFSDRLDAKIEQHGKTRKWLASEVGISNGTIAMWKTRQSFPDADKAVLVAKALGTTVEYLVTGNEIIPDLIPPHLHKIVNDLNYLSEEQLEIISLQVSAVAESNRRAHGDKTSNVG